MAEYRAPSLSDLHFAELDGLTALYHRASGQTHIIIDPLPDLIRALADAPLNEEQLLARLGIDAPEAEDRAGLSAHLATLIACGVVERI